METRSQKPTEIISLAFFLWQLSLLLVCHHLCAYLKPVNFLTTPKSSKFGENGWTWLILVTPSCSFLAPKYRWFTFLFGFEDFTFTASLKPWGGVFTLDHSTAACCFAADCSCFWGVGFSRTIPTQKKTKNWFKKNGFVQQLAVQLAPGCQFLMI